MTDPDEIIAYLCGIPITRAEYEMSKQTFYRWFTDKTLSAKQAYEGWRTDPERIDFSVGPVVWMTPEVRNTETLEALAAEHIAARRKETA